jgi:hypothetical protein
MGISYDRPLKSAEKAVALKRLRKARMHRPSSKMRSDLLEAPFCLFDGVSQKLDKKTHIRLQYSENAFDNYQFNLG